MVLARTRSPPIVRPLCRYVTTTARSNVAVEEHDLVLLGLGPIGLSLAAALSHSPLISSTHRLTLLEANSLQAVQEWQPVEGRWSNRCSSVTATNWNWLHKIGMGQHLIPSRSNPIHHLSITTASPASNPLTFSSTPPLSHMTENIHLQHAALSSLKGRKGVEFLDGRKVIGIEEGDGGWPVVELGPSAKDPMGQGKRLRGRLLIGADGPNSPVKAYSKIDSFGWKYDEMQGLVGTVDLEPPLPTFGGGVVQLDTAYQRFLNTGPIALLPVSNTTASFVWSTTPSQVAHLKTLSPPHLIAELNAALSPSSPSSAPPNPFSPSSSSSAPTILRVHEGSLASFPLQMKHSSSYIGGAALRTALVGDAAHSVHPLAGQGLNMGLGDARALVETLEEAIAAGGDLGSTVSLRAYPRKVYIPNHLLLSSCDHLASLFSRQENPVLGWGIQNGFEVLNELDSVKGALMAFAGGEPDALDGSGRGEGKRDAGVWEGVAKAIEGMDKVRGVLGLVGGLVAQRVMGGLVRGRTVGR